MNKQQIQSTNREIQENQIEEAEDPNKNVANNSEKFVVHLIVDFHEICKITAALPLVTLLSCFVTAYVFQSEEVHETHCRVYNIIPSISAITGVSPQRYFWRLCIAFHIGPRIPITVMYRNYYRNYLLMHDLTDDVFKRAKLLINLVFWLHMVEVIALGGVTYVSNRENYPIHEKIFITFMVCSLCHMLATIKLYEILHPKEKITETQEKSLKWKKIIFAVSILSTIGLFLFFLKHRLFCHELAFSWFALCEYIIATANMVFHCTTIWDFPSEYLLLAQGSREYFEKHFLKTTLIDKKKVN
ncbi:post-GPI attachment to proteins factor 2-like [Condylostylus longicornis]|uniref:post-GPI attachment to proteins factor 2-like n=1 Tax=Condylostylus longicornis TaxID=2530218 RepID=UPI00244E3236|nr:post-GPI attachment to proteins factor 2-like [Condylostylus longicornis]